MRTKTSSRGRAAGHQTRDESAADAALERFLADHHREVDAKLQQARDSFARGEAKELEPLSTLLRQARRQAKAR